MVIWVLRILGYFGDWIFGGNFDICKNRSDWDIWDICKNRSDLDIWDVHIFAKIVWTGIFGIFGYLQEKVVVGYLGYLDICKNRLGWDIGIFARIGRTRIFGYMQE